MLLAAILLLALLVPAASAETVGSDLDTLTPTGSVTCPRSEACIVAQSLGGNGTPFSPPEGIVTSWSLKLGASAPQGIRLVVQKAGGTGGIGQPRKTIDVGSLQQSPAENGVNRYPERLPIHGDETFGVRLEASNRAATRATILATFSGEYRTVLRWDPPPPFGGPAALADGHFESARIAISADVAPPRPQRCDPFNTFTGSRHGDDYGGFDEGGDLIYGFGGADQLRGYRLEDCIYGGRGNDRIAGMDDADVLSGGPGRDDIGAGQGNDRILVRDGARDVVRCGSGRDIVKADRRDRLSGCERVQLG